MFTMVAPGILSTIPAPRMRRQIALALLACGVALSFPVLGLSQVELDFEQGNPSWQLRETDCAIPTSAWTQRRTNLEKHGGQTSEQFHFQTGHGTKIMVAQAIEPSYLIPELQPELWVKSNRDGLRMLARVVIPKSQAPDGKGPVKIMIEGAKYTNAGNWQRLSFGTGPDSLEQLLQKQLWALRTKFGSAIDPEGAFIDLIVLNLYSGPGVCDVWVDDLRIAGAVSATESALIANGIDTTGAGGAVRLTAQQDEVPQSESLVRFDGNIMELRGQPFFVRAIQHNGEPFEWLRQIGFNVIELRSPATFDQLQAAQQLDLWLVCPPPTTAGLSPIGLEFDRVLAWSVGRNLTGRDYDNVRQLVKEIQHSDPRKGRPIVADVRSNWVDYGQTVHILSTNVDPIGGGFRLTQYGPWLAQRQQLAGKTVPIWAAIPTELPAEVIAQVAALSDRVPPTPLQPQQLEFALFEALAGGARGLRFLSRSRLDATDPVTLLRAQTLKWLNVRVSQAEPWGAGGAVSGGLPLSDPKLKVTALQTERARLLLIQRPTELEQWTAGESPLDKISFVDVGASATDRAYWLAPSGMIPLPSSTIHGGAQIEIEHCPPLAMVVETDSPIVVNRLANSYRAPDGQSLSQLRADTLRNWLAIVQLIDQQMVGLGRSDVVASGAINEAITFLQRAEAMIAGSNAMTADEYFDQAEQRLALACKQFLSTARAPFRSAGASALLVHPLLVPNHWQLATQLGQANWQPNALAGGDFENLEHMVKNGWVNRRTEEENIETRVELSPAATVGGSRGLSLSATSQSSGLDVVESAPVWITSGNIPVKSGQMVRIHGWAKLDTAIQGSLEGLTIIDSLGGASLAERITRPGQWQEFSLYRGAAADGNLNITFALTGLGTALIDEVTVRIADPNQPPPVSEVQESAAAESAIAR